MEAVKVREELSEYLDGLQEQMPLAFWKLAEIFKYQVFELCEEPEEKEEESGKSYLIPYMTNLRMWEKKSVQKENWNF